MPTQLVIIRLIGGRAEDAGGRRNDQAVAGMLSTHLGRSLGQSRGQ